MGYSEFDARDNSLIVISGDKFPNNKHQVCKIENQQYYSLILDGQDTIGIKVERFLSNVELKGYRAEVLFKHLLDQTHIPYLHIGQSPWDHSRTLQDAKSKRPDFLVNVPDLGMLLFDVKCRKKMGFENTNKKFFQINREEIEKLFLLQNKLLLPVWIAFLDEADIHHIHDEVENKCNFYLASISELYKFLARLKPHFSDREYSMVSSIRIPYSLLSEFAGRLNLTFGDEKVSDQELIKITQGYKFILARAEKSIIEYIKNNNIYRSYLSDEVRPRHMLKNEIDHILNILIKENIVKYQPKSHLKLNKA